MFQILQINLNRCRLAQDLLVQNACQLGVDLVIISEPYRVLPEWMGDTTGDAAIWIIGFKGRFASLAPSVSAEGIATATVGNTVVVSCYCRPSRKGPDFLKYLEDLEEILISRMSPGMGVVVAGDFNAKSPAWGGKAADRRDHAVLGLLARVRMVPVRLRDKATFCSSRGSSFIDVMSMERGLAGRVRRSEVLRHYTASDHRYVLHVLNNLDTPRRSPLGDWTPYAMRDVSPGAILKAYRALKENPSALPHLPPEPPPAHASSPAPSYLEEPRAERFQRVLQGVCEGTLKKRSLPRGTRKPNRWWTPEIAEARHDMHRARRAFQRKRSKLDPSSPRLEQLRREFSLARRMVQILI